MKKVFPVSLEENMVDWIRQEVKQGHFRSRSYAVEFMLEAYRNMVVQKYDKAELKQFGQMLEEVQRRAEKLEQIVRYVKNTGKIVENFLKVYHSMILDGEHLDKIYGCLMGYTRIISSIGLPKIVPNKKYDELRESTADMKKRVEEFTEGYKDTMAKLDEKILGEKQEMLKEVKQVA